MIRFTSKKLKKDLKERLKSIENIQLSHSGMQTQLKKFTDKYGNDLLIGPVYKFYQRIGEVYRNLNKAIDENRENSYSSIEVITKELTNILNE